MRAAISKGRTNLKLPGVSAMHSSFMKKRLQKTLSTGVAEVDALVGGLRAANY